MTMIVTLVCYNYREGTAKQLWSTMIIPLSTPLRYGHSKFSSCPIIGCIMLREPSPKSTFRVLLTEGIAAYLEQLYAMI